MDKPSSCIPNRYWLKAIFMDALLDEAFAVCEVSPPTFHSTMQVVVKSFVHALGRSNAKVFMQYLEHELQGDDHK